VGFLKDGALFITGRLKDLIIVEGRNHYPQDIEWTATQSHPAIRPGCVTAFSADMDNRERLIVAAELRPPALAPGGAPERPTPGDVVRAIRRAIAEEHEVRVYDVVLLAPGATPKTSSGKLARHRCRAEYLEDALERVES